MTSHQDVRLFCCPRCSARYSIYYYILNPVEDLICDCGVEYKFVRATGKLYFALLRQTAPADSFIRHPDWPVISFLDL